MNWPGPSAVANRWIRVTVYADLLLWMRPDRKKLAEFDDRWTRGGTGSSAQHSLPG
jgi:hypothetical protein